MVIVNRPQYKFVLWRLATALSINLSYGDWQPTSVSYWLWRLSTGLTINLSYGDCQPPSVYICHNMAIVNCPQQYKLWRLSTALSINYGDCKLPSV